jgi:tetratricopeptide (TPR) repeat protein
VKQLVGLLIGLVVLPNARLVLAQDSPEYPDESVGALVSLGASHAIEGNYARALEAYEDASDLSRRQEGLFNTHLIEILGLMQDTVMAGGDQEQAREYRIEAQRIEQRILEKEADRVGKSEGRDSPAYLEARLALARWLAGQREWRPRSELSESARYWCWSRKSEYEYLDILKLVQKEFDDDPALNVRVLRMMAADTFGIRAVPLLIDCPTSESFWLTSIPEELKQAINILDSVDEPDLVLYASVLTDIADRQFFINPDEALESFREAWGLLESAEGGHALQSEWFGRPQMLYQGSPEYSPGLLSNALGSLPGQVEIEFVVDPQGLARDYRVISADTTWAADMVAEIVGKSRFRPRLESGEFVSASSSFTWDYRYDPSVAAELNLDLPDRD